MSSPIRFLLPCLVVACGPGIPPTSPDAGVRAGGAAAGGTASAGGLTGGGSAVAGGAAGGGAATGGGAGGGAPTSGGAAAGGGAAGGGSSTGGGVAGGASGGGSSGGVADAGQGLDGGALDTGSRVLAFLEGKLLTMAGGDIPRAPNGYDQNVYFGAVTQCYHRVTHRMTLRNFLTTATAGTWSQDGGFGLPINGTVGTCNTAMAFGTPGVFTTTLVTVANVQGDADCFDVTLVYPTYSQEGRGRISVDRSVAELELYFSPQATGHRCANGSIGDGGVRVLGTPVTLGAVQRYVISQ